MMIFSTLDTFDIPLEITIATRGTWFYKHNTVRTTQFLIWGKRWGPFHRAGAGPKFYYIIKALGYVLKAHTWFNPTLCAYRIREIHEFSLNENDLTTESGPRAIPKRGINKSTLQNQNHQAIYKGARLLQDQSHQVSFWQAIACYRIKNLPTTCNHRGGPPV